LIVCIGLRASLFLIITATHFSGKKIMYFPLVRLT
jgi:hypothetical protein